DGATKEADKALQLDPASIPAISVKVGIYSAKEDVKGAEAAMDAGIKLNPKNVALLVLKVAFYKRHNLPDKVAESYQEIFASYPAERSYRAEAAGYFSDQGQLDRAEQILRDGVDAAPQDIDMKRLLVSFLNLKRGMEPAEQELQKLINAEPDNNNY